MGDLVEAVQTRAQRTTGGGTEQHGAVSTQNTSWVRALEPADFAQDGGGGVRGPVPGPGSRGGKEKVSLLADSAVFTSETLALCRP